MVAKDLKIGDWVYFDNPAREKKEVAKVVAILNDVQLNIVRLEDNTPLLVVISDIVPIPLTKEILEKNGWHDDYDSFSHDDCELFLPTEYKDKRHTEIESIDVYNHIFSEGEYNCNPGDLYLRTITHVHQFQHILWALGMNDEIKVL